eukprot:2912360-Alexandrium_andersonii.AAC.1
MGARARVIARGRLVKHRRLLKLLVAATAPVGLPIAGTRTTSAAGLEPGRPSPAAQVHRQILRLNGVG